MDTQDFDSPAEASPPAAGAGAGGLTPRQKAAVIVSLALAEGADLPLDDMPRPLQELLARQIAALGPVGEATLAAVVEEFDAELGGRVAVPSGSRAALRMLDGRLHPEALAPLREGYAGPDPWERVGRVPAEALIPLVGREADEVAATIVSRLPTERAAQVLTALPGPQARRIAFGVSRIAAVEPGLMRALGEAIVAEVEARPPSAVQGGPDRRVGAILNAASSRVRDELLAGLRETDRDFAEAVRRTIFTFADIEARLETSDVAPLMRALDDDTQAAALAFARAEGLEGSVAHLLGAMPKRMAERLGEALDAWSGTAEAGEAAMSLVCETIRRMEEDGQLTLKPPA